MKKKHYIKRCILSGLLLLAVAIGVTGRIYASNLWDEDRAVHINPSDIETSTFAIGTHLVHLSALNQELYEIAMDSAGKSMQEQIYYKSELGDDAWFNIGTATSLADISTEGTPVKEQEIKDLFFTHHTKSDKKTYDLRSNQQVNVFNIHSPYDLESMEELLPLKMQYDLLRETKGKEDFARRIERIWELRVSGHGAPDSIKELDRQMNSLQKYLNVLTDHDAPSEQTGKVNSVMKEIDEARRYEVFLIIEPALSNYLEELNQSASEEKEKNQPPAELMPAVAESIGNVQNALIKHGGARLSKGVTVMSNAKYDFSVSLIEHAVEGNHRLCDDDVKDLILLDNIENDKISDRPQELKILNDDLLKRATDAYTDVLSTGESAEYRAEKKKQSSRAVLNSMINAHAAAASTTRGELEFFIDAECSRLDTNGAIDFIDERMKITTDKFATMYPKDDFANEAGKSVQDHIDYLSEKHRSLELSQGGNEMDQLVNEKEELKEKRLEALDQNDLKTAKKIEEQLEENENKVRALEAETAAKLAQLQDKLKELPKDSAEYAAAKAELASLENSLSDGTVGAIISDLKNAALNGDKEALNSLTGMLATAPELALPAIQEVYNDLLLNDGDKEMIDSLEQAILENPNALREDLSSGAILGITDEWLEEHKPDQENAGAGGSGGTGTGGSGGTGTGGSGGTGTGGSGGTGTGGSGGTGTGGSGGTGTGGSGGTGTGGSGGTGTGGDGGTGTGGSGGTGTGGDGSSGTGGDGGSGTGGDGSSGTGGDGGSGTGGSGGTGTGGDGGTGTGGSGGTGTGGSGGTGTGGSGGTGTGGDGGSGTGGDGSSGTGGSGGTGTDGDSGSGTGGIGSDLSGLGSDFGILGGGSKTDAAAILALQMYYDETGNQAALPILSSKALEQCNLGNPLLFKRINDSSGEYIPITAIQPLTGRRFVWNKNKSLGILALGRDYYGFRMYSDFVLRDRDGEKTERMERPTKNLGVIHIPEEYAQSAFGVQSMYLANTDYGCACDDELFEMAQELFTRFLENS